jgi:DNA processing protein
MSESPRTPASAAARVHLRWALSEGVGPILFARILESLGSAERALDASATQIETIRGIGRGRADAILSSAAKADIESELAACARHGVRVICREDDEYPPGLLQIPDAPIVLFVRGDLRPTDAVAIAVVGSRRCSLYGSEQARRFGELLAGAGFTVVSGLARGIDAFAHHGAVDAGGRSVGVLGCGLDSIYPPENAALADKVIASGALVSELPIATAVRAANFPARNRIIAGMALGTLVIEAADRSGALITARYAGEDYNREVFAVPGRVQDPMSMGTNALIRDGKAKLTTCLEDVLSELGDVGKLMRPEVQRSVSDAGTPKNPDAARPLALSQVERAVYEVIPFDPVMQDVILSALNVPPGEALAAVTTLELKGMIRRMPGNLVVRIGRV